VSDVYSHGDQYTDADADEYTGTTDQYTNADADEYTGTTDQYANADADGSAD
jgi:hypothetical protein